MLFSGYRILSYAVRVPDEGRQRPTDGEGEKNQTENHTGVAYNWEDPHHVEERPSTRRRYRVVCLASLRVGYLSRDLGCAESGKTI